MAKIKLTLPVIGSGGGSGGVTNLSYIASPTQGVVTSDTGSDATIPLADNTNAGLLSPSEKLDISTALQSGDITQYTDELAQDAVGGILADTTTIDLSYNDSLNTISADVKPNSITAIQLADNINISEFVNDENFITDINLVHLTGDETIDGIKEFIGEIKNTAATTDNTPAYFITSQTDGVHKKTPAALIAFKSDLPASYAVIVYVNATTPNTATIFNLNNPPITNDNLLKNDTANLYIGTDASTWVYNGSIYITKTVPATSPFKLLSGINAGGNTTSSIYREGSFSSNAFVSSNAGMFVNRDGSTTAQNGGFFSFSNSTASNSMMFQLNASNGLDLWNYSSSTWNKRFTFSSGGDLTLHTAPTTSAGTYDILTRNISTGVVEKVTSASVATTASPTFTGTVVLPSTTSIGTVTNTELSYVDGVTSSIQTQLNGKQSTLTNPVTGTGTTNYIAKFTGSGTVDNSGINQTPNGYCFSSGLYRRIYIKEELGAYGFKSVALDDNDFNRPIFFSGSNVRFFSGSTSSTVVSEKMRLADITGNLLVNTDIDNGVDVGQFNGSISATNYTGSATLTGTPTAPTATAGTNTTQIATTAFVQANDKNLGTSNLELSSDRSLDGILSASVGTYGLSLENLKHFKASSFQAGGKRAEFSLFPIGQPSKLFELFANQDANLEGSPFVDGLVDKLRLGFYEFSGNSSSIDIQGSIINYKSEDHFFSDFFGNNQFYITSGLFTLYKSASESGTFLGNILTSNRNYTLPDASGTLALLDSPTLTGTPTAPTATAGTNTTQIATTAFVQSELTVVNSDFLLYSMSF